MIDLESRLRALADPDTAPSTAPADALRAVAARRRRTRRTVAGVAVPLAVTLLAVMVWTLIDDQPQQLTTGPSSTPTSSNGSEPPASTDSRTLGGLTGVSVTVTPRHDLADGQLVDVQVDGIERVPGATIAICAGDVTESTAATSCDFGSVGSPTADETAQIVATEQQTVSVSRTIHIARGGDPNVTAPYDCAVEPTGCVLGIGPVAIPVRAVLVPLTFEDVALPVPSATLEPSKGLRAGQETALTAEGLTPNATYSVTECRVGAQGGCDVISTVSTIADAEGRVTTSVPVWAAIYRYDGRVDCTVEACSLALTRMNSELVVEVPFSFAADVVAPTPDLQLDPAGPYQDQQIVTVRGTGFRPGLNLLGQLGQCPADKDTATEERCGYDLYTAVEAVIVDATGRFSTSVRLHESLTFTGSCTGTPGCILGWVIPHGTTLAKVPLTFRS